MRDTAGRGFETHRRALEKERPQTNLTTGQQSGSRKYVRKYVPQSESLQFFRARLPGNSKYATGLPNSLQSYPSTSFLHLSLGSCIENARPAQMGTECLTSLRTQNFSQTSQSAGKSHSNSTKRPKVPCIPTSREPGRRVETDLANDPGITWA